MRRLRILNIMFAIVAILLAAFSIYLALKWDNTKKELTKTQVLVDSLYTNYNLLHGNATQAAGLLRAMSDTSIVHVELSGMPLTPEEQAYLYWNKSNGEVYVNPFGLSSSEKNEYYQLWAFKEGNESVSLGLINMDKSPYLIQRMRDVNEAEEFGIIKVSGGEKNRPLLEKMVVASQ